MTIPKPPPDPVPVSAPVDCSPGGGAATIDFVIGGLWLVSGAMIVACGAGAGSSSATNAASSATSTGTWNMSVSFCTEPSAAMVAAGVGFLGLAALHGVSGAQGLSRAARCREIEEATRRACAEGEGAACREQLRRDCRNGDEDACRALEAPAEPAAPDGAASGPGTAALDPPTCPAGGDPDRPPGASAAR
jgi:hypothetical protein